MCRSQANYCGNFNCSLKYSVRSILDLFQGIGTMFAQSPQIAIARVVLIFLGFLLVYLGVKGTLEPLIMVPMGLGMSAVNAGVLFLGENQIGNLIIDPLLSTTDELMTYMQINFLQPIYNLTFSNGLIACLVFMGIGILCDIGYVLEHPFISMTIALFAELGTVATYPIARAMGLVLKMATAVILSNPIARAMGLDAGSSAAVSIIGGYVVYFFKKGKFNPTVGIAGVSCVPSTAKVAQKAAAKANPAAFILDYALGANICGVITTAILTGIYITLLS